MLRWEEKEDIDQRMAEVDDVVSQWRDREEAVPEELRTEFHDKLMISWVYHDAALEGDVLTYSEIKAATDAKIISDVSLIPAYEDIKNFHAACVMALDQATTHKRKALSVDMIKKLYGALAPEEVAKGCPYRKENPLHRLYYHEIAAPEKINYHMRKLGEFLDDDALRTMHALERIATVHTKLMGVFPWAKHSGRVARIVSNMMLRQEGYPLAVIHAIDRQRYYESLRGDDDKLLLLYMEAVETTAQAAIRVYDEAMLQRGRRRRKAS